MRGRASVQLQAVLALLVLVGCAITRAEPAPAVNVQPATDPFPAVPTLRPQVDFWIEVFSRLHRNEVVLHDTHYPQIRYEVFTLPGTVGEGLDREQRRTLDRHRDQLSTRLETLEHKVRRAAPLDSSEQQLLQQVEAGGGQDALRDAAQRVRAQRGLQEQFLAGVYRSGRYIEEMRRIFAERGLPPDLAWLPHVESSFNIDARSTVGAAGIWQFTRATGRRYLQISNALDERLDPFAATRAAADYLAAAHNALNDWALAITSYNHGTSGMLRAARQHGADLERIVRDYESDSFGFASSNFYTEFLAVREILNHPGRYFDAPLAFDAPAQLQSLQLPKPASAPRLARTLDTDVSTLAGVNPAWLDRTLRGQVSLPAGTRVWLPAQLRTDRQQAHAQLAAAAPDPAPLPDPGADSYKVRSGDTLEKIARHHGISVSTLRRANGIRPGSALIRTGQQLVLPDGGTRHKTTSIAAAGPTLHSVRQGENPFVIARHYRISLNNLLAANGLDSNAILRPGQRLRIPDAATP